MRAVAVALLGLVLAACAGSANPDTVSKYPWHTDILATTFWVGEIFDPKAPDGSQEMSAYDGGWMKSFGGCDGVVDAAGVCTTERRTAQNGYAPERMKPKQNYFYVALPFDDVNDPEAFAMRGDVVPWAGEPGYAGREADKSFSYLKNRWVRVARDGRVCYGQIQDAGPGVYDDARYVFGRHDERPANRKYHGTGLDVSPALNGCLGFAALDGAGERVSWQFVDAAQVPDGPWKKIITTGQVRP